MLDLVADPHHLCLERAGPVLACRQAGIPQVLEHGAGDAQHVGLRAQAAQHDVELAFDLVPADRLAIAVAALLLAEIVGIERRAPLRPTGGQRHVAFAADDSAAQCEVFGQILARGRSRGLGQPRLDFLIGLKADQRLVMSFAQRHVPVRGPDIPGVNRPRQHIIDALTMNGAVRPAREFRLRFKEPSDLGLQLEAPRGEAFESLLQDRGDRLVADQHFAMSRNTLKAIADRRLKDPIAVHDPRPHAVLGLLAVLLPLVLGDAGEQIFDEDGIGVFAELDRRRFQHSARSGNRRPQLQMRFQAARQARNIVDDDDVRMAAVLAQMGQHRLHAGPVDQTAGHVVGKDLDHFIALVLGVFAAAGLLRTEAVAARLLLGVRDPAIDQGAGLGGSGFLMHWCPPLLGYRWPSR